MARVKLLSAMAYDVATYEDQGVADPVIRVSGELPAHAQPWSANRVYKGAQGRYEEGLLLLDPDDVVIYERPGSLIQLRGEMFEDLFRSVITDAVRIESTGEHHLVFLLNGIEAGRIPVFISAPESARASGVLDKAVETSLKKGSVLWLTIPQPDGSDAERPAWYVQQGKSVFVIKGPDEQTLPHLEHNDVVDMTVKSKDINATIGVMPASVRVVDNDSDEFTKVATLGMGTRLNLPDGNDALERWRATCTMVELTPRY